ncbi:hypothetical protein JAAARDRAFT_505908 [Jaapia argillacea MUCL 33604]|uniref:Protein kinase domain-containing protein n=1 Tax=Jaapia argillacea MUCL 33604 TaxID=933084 RepID=A0A067PMQ0_9AGAM|nr:hypothetical protein JAAARDRAFT_505908 [Jaapia argillacea MUCL 33604]
MTETVQQPLAENKSPRSALDSLRRLGSKQLPADPTQVFVETVATSLPDVVGTDRWNHLVNAAGLSACRVLNEQPNLNQYLLLAILEEIASSNIDETAINNLRRWFSECQAIDDSPIALAKNDHIRSELLSMLGHTMTQPNRKLLSALVADDVRIVARLQTSAICSLPAGTNCLEAEDIQHVLDMLQRILDSFKSSSQIYIELPLSVNSPFYIDFTQMTHRLLVKLSEASGHLPSSLFIRELTLREADPVHGGGFADVYTGMIGQQKVAIKRLRIHLIPKTQDRAKLIKILCREVLI